MADEREVRRLLEEMLDSGLSAEEVCKDDAELLSHVQERLRRLRAVESQVDVLFPPASPSNASASKRIAAEPPQLPGYEIKSVLGHGGMSIVYEAWDHRLNRPVAIKTLLAGVHAHPEERERFRRGAEAKASLRHPNIVHVYNVGDLDGQPYLTMEFVDGGSLAEKLSGGPLPAVQAAALLAMLADAVQAAHDQGIIHRDLKPANILLTSDGVPKISDFGLARRLNDPRALTNSGAALGTPSYMAPEQAQGQTHTAGATADVYSLGAILYEALTGLPPFRGNTPSETMRQVVEQEPQPLSRWNAKLPRDLDVICLKCLQKEPHQRYPTAAALADDLHRFQRGEAITARPPGPAERLARWLQRRRFQVAVFLVGTILGIGLVAAGMWLWSRHEADIRRDLERAKREQDFAAKLDAIHLKRATLAEGRFNSVAERRFNNARADRDYDTSFRDAGFGSIGDAPEAVAARIAASSAFRPLVAALDDWAACATDTRRRAWILEVARRSDPDAWRDRVRDAWEDRSALAKLAQSAPLAKQPVAILLAMGERMQDFGADGIAFLSRVQRAHPDDFWAASTLALALQQGADPEAAVASYRRALELRGDVAYVYNNLGLIAHPRRDWKQAYELYDKALEIDPEFAPAHNNLGLALKGEGKWPEAIYHFRKAIRLDHELAPAHYNLAEIRAFEAGLDEALTHYGQALQIDPAFALAEYMLGVTLAGEGRLDEAVDRNQRAMAIDSADAKAHEKIFGYAEREGLIHYHLTLGLDPQLSLSRNNLGLSPQDTNRINQAIGHYEKALQLDPELFRAHASLGQAFLALARLKDAEAATQRCLDRLPQGHELHANVLAQLRHCQRLITLEARLSAVLQGKDNPADAAETLEFAELFGSLEKYGSAARLYANTFAATPQLAEDIHTPHRYRAACAAALAGCGRGDGASLAPAERAGWRERAREWLRAEVNLWTEALDRGPQAVRVVVRDRLAHLWSDPALAGLFDPEAQKELPPSEREECRALWGQIDALILRAQVIE